MRATRKKKDTSKVVTSALGSRLRDSDGTVVGAYFTDLDRYNPVTPAEEQELFRRYRNGDMSAKREIIHANLRFVIKVAQRYLGQGVPFPDLISEGNRGLIYAIDKFEPNKNFKFISDAVWWIRQAILKYVSEQSRIVSIPLNQTQRIISITKSLERFLQKGISEPTPEEVAQDTGLPVSAVKVLFPVMPKAASLDAPTGKNSDITIMDTLVANAEDPLETLVESSLSDDLHIALQDLSEVERRIIMYMYGFANNHIYTLNEVGDILGVSRERVRQVKDKAVKKLQIALCERVKAA